MPQTIPYDPSLVLGNIVHPSVLAKVEAISAAQAPVDAAEEKYHSYVMMKRSLDLTITELINMKIDSSKLQEASDKTGQEIAKAAADYANKRLQSENIIQPIRATMRSVHSEIESPIDYNKTEFIKKPLSFDSIKLDAQYFAFDENKQTSSSTIASMKAWVEQSTSFLAFSQSSQASAAVTSQVSHQLETHDIEGTLIITASCTHKNAMVLAPFILDVDKAIRVWNALYKDSKINVHDPSSIAQIAAEEGTSNEKFMYILSGATFGSSFVGMIHILKRESTSQRQEMFSLAASMQSKFEVGWFGVSESGGFGLDASFSSDFKDMLSKSRLDSHITLYAMGMIPSIKSNVVKTSIKEFSNFDAGSIMGKLTELHNATSSDNKSVSSSASQARMGSQMMAMENSKVTNVMLSAAKIENDQNKTFDTNSLMTAFEDYVEKAIAGDIGVPINYYLKPISRAQLAQMWMAKYFPDSVLVMQGDDSARPEKKDTTN